MKKVKFKMISDNTFIVSEIGNKNSVGKKIYCNKFLAKIYKNENFHNKFEYEIEENFNYILKKQKKFVPLIGNFIASNNKEIIPTKIIESIVSENIYRLLITIKNHFDEFEKYKKSYKLNNINLKNIKYPYTLSELVDLSISSSLFKEQIFTLYVKKFYNIKNSFDYYPNENKKLLNKKSKFSTIIYYIENKIFFKFLLNNFLKKIRKSQPKILIIKSYFSKKNRFLLDYYSKGKIITNNFPNYKASKTKVFKNRDQIKKNFIAEDKFDEFFLYVLENFFPRLYLEDFDENIDSVKSFIKSNISVESILNESFSVDDYRLFYLKILKFYNNIKHIYIEHNCIHHPFFGSRTEELSLVPDKMFTLGWESNHFKHAKKGASLFEFKKKLKKKKYDILYISHAIQNVHHNFRNFLCGEKSLAYYERIKNIFSKLSIDTCERITHKPYPLSKLAGVSLTLEDYCENEFKNFKNTLDRETNALDCIVRSNCLFIDFLSTSFWQALKTGVPTVCLWHDDMQKLDVRFKDYFDELINANILITDINNVDKIINRNFKNPYEWWNSEKVSSARNNFLANNLCEDEIMINKILKF